MTLTVNPLSLRCDVKLEVIGDCKLYLSDCNDILDSIERPDVVITDPPFGINYRSGFSTDELWAGGPSIENDCDTSARDSALLKLDGIPALVFGVRRVSMPKGARATLIWDKGPALGMGALDIPWKPSYEEIYVIGKGFNGKRDGAVIYCPPVQSMAKNGRCHPNEKPVRLLSILLNKCPEGVVLDPFMGSGSTGVACIGMGRKFIGIEVNQKYFDIACSRIEDAYRQQRLFA